MKVGKTARLPTGWPTDAEWERSQSKLCCDVVVFPGSVFRQGTPLESKAWVGEELGKKIGQCWNTFIPLTSPFSSRLSWPLSHVPSSSIISSSSCLEGLVNKPQMSVHLYPCTRAGTRLCTTGQGTECGKCGMPWSGVMCPLCVSCSLPSSHPSRWTGATS